MASTINASTSGGLVTTADTSGVLQLQTANTTAVTIDASQNVGVGVTPSAWNAAGYKAFEIGSFGNAIYSSTNDVIFTANAYYNSGWKYGSTNPASRYDQNNAAHKWYTAPSGTAGNAISFTQAMTLDAAGNLGLGVTPSAWNSSIRAIDISSSGTVLADSSGIGVSQNAYYDSAWKYKNTGTASRYAAVAGAHSWYTAPSGTAGNAITFTQAMTLDASGNLGIGTSSPSQTLTVNGAVGYNAPVTVTGATYSVLTTDNWIIANRAGTVTLTLPTASSFTGRILTVKNVQAQTVVSNASNVVPIGSTTAGTAILTNTAGKFATLVSDGTNWIIMQAN